jgi:hypothetical protein
MATRLVLHVGVMKSGTTFVQRVLLANKDRLGENGILFPGKNWRQQVVAVRDLIDNVSPEANTLAPDGPWNAMAEQIRAWPGTAVFSMEFLGPRTPEQIAVVRDSFPGTTAEVVITVRDLARSITSMWTEIVQNRGTSTWPAYLRAVRGERSKPGRGFWRQQRIPAITQRWTQAFGPDHVTLITVPPRGAPRDTLWLRFCEVSGIPAGLCDLDVPGNAALDAPSAMVMRALNERLADAGIDLKDYDRFVKRGLAKNGINKRADRGPSVGLDERWVIRRARRELDELRALDPRVIGDLAEIESHRVPGVHTDKISTEQQLEAALDGMAALVMLWAADVRRRERRERRRRRKKEKTG